SDHGRAAPINGQRERWSAQRKRQSTNAEANGSSKRRVNGGREDSIARQSATTVAVLLTRLTNVSSSALAPLELGAQDREEMLLRKAEQTDARRGAPYLDDVRLPEREADLAVRGQHHVLVGEQRDLDTLGARQHDRPVG